MAANFRQGAENFNFGLKFSYAFSAGMWSRSRRLSLEMY